MKSILCLLVILSFFVGIDCSAQKRKRVKSVETEQYDVFRIPDSVDFEERVALLFNHYNSYTFTLIRRVAWRVIQYGSKHI